MVLNAKFAGHAGNICLFLQLKVQYKLSEQLNWRSHFIHKPNIAVLVVSLFVVSSAYASSAPAFPDGFRWCVSTSAHQIEGANSASDWWEWEQIPGHIANGDRSTYADDHWNRVDEDIALMQSLHVTDYRMTVEWSKIEPQEGQYDNAAILHYKDEVQKLQFHGIQPLITLQHVTFPDWVRKKGGFEWSGIDEAFAGYVSLVYREIAPTVRDFVTINEPTVSLASGYIGGVYPPGEKRQLSGLVPVIRGILRAHAKAYHVLHQLAAQSGRTVRVGMAHALRTEDPYNPWSLADIIVSSIADSAWNWAIPEAMETGRIRLQALWFINVNEKIEGLKGTQDFVGVNYYSGDLIQFSFKEDYIARQRKNLPKSDLGWDIYPRGLYRILKRAAHKFPGKPIMITENGIADANDSKRPKYIYDHLQAVQQAIHEGARVEGYCEWSLMDNFEWADGYTPRFGLFEVDYKTFERHPRASAQLFGEIARTNSLIPLTR